MYDGTIVVLYARPGLDMRHVNELPYQGRGPGDGGDLWLLFGGFQGHIRLYKIKTSVWKSVVNECALKAAAQDESPSQHAMWPYVTDDQLKLQLKTAESAAQLWPHLVQ